MKYINFLQALITNCLIVKITRQINTMIFFQINFDSFWWNITASKYFNLLTTDKKANQNHPVVLNLIFCYFLYNCDPSNNNFKLCELDVHVVKSSIEILFLVAKAKQVVSVEMHLDFIQNLGAEICLEFHMGFDGS